jgi:hypothetical protein
MNPQLIIPMGPTGPAPTQTIDVTPVGTGYVAPVSETAPLVWIGLGLFLFYLYKHHRRGGFRL